MGADIVLFPEMWSNGYAPPFDGAFDNPLNPAFHKERTEWLENAIFGDSEYIATLKTTAKQLHIGICATYLSATSLKPQNTAIIIDRNGNVILDYAKVHTCDFSLEKLLQNGDDHLCGFSYQ